ncbi:hypothetical protein BX666DRAFT_1882538 [Dichotomocladium elegans]|nr:hypothetical protein BX666DRAFT_1882538 [Dichotomocladium elegans]
MAVPINTKISSTADSDLLGNAFETQTHPPIGEVLRNPNDECKDKQGNAMKPESVGVLRMPIHRCKANAQTVYITTGYGWSQTKETVVIYLTIQNAIRITPDQYLLEVEPRSVQLTISGHEGANYNFRISQLNGEVVPGKSTLKVTSSGQWRSKIIVHLFKARAGREWTDIRLRSTRDVYDQLERERVDRLTKYNLSVILTQYNILD